MERSSARRQISLVPFVKAGDERGHKKSDTRPLNRPAKQARTAQRRSPGAEQQQAQHKIAGKMTQLADVEMPSKKADWVQAHQEMQNRIENSAGVVGGSQIGGFASDQEEPEAGGDPGLQYLLLGGVHAGVPQEESGRNPVASKSVKPRRARGFTTGSELELFDGIVGGLARNHDIVDVAFAEPSAANADEASLLQ
jgi:hypothetical protein